MDLEAELARFEAELAAVEKEAPSQPSSSHAAAAAAQTSNSSSHQAHHSTGSSLRPSAVPPPSMPPPSMPPPSMPPPAFPPPSNIPPPPSHPPFNNAFHYPPPSQPPQSRQGPQLSTVLSTPLAPPQHLPPPLGPPPFQPPPGMVHSAPPSHASQQGPQTMYYAPPQINPQLLMEEPPAPAQLTDEEIQRKLKEEFKKTSEDQKKKPAKGIKRKAAGQTWWDPTLTEWPPNDFRVFVGDLGNEVNDEILTKAFQKYPSFAKAKVVRDKHTNKSKGYGFVSVLDGNDFAKLMKEMNGKYIGNRPCKLRKSEWTERNAPTFKKNKGGQGQGAKGKGKK